jgi:hypothetical protein
MPPMRLNPAFRRHPDEAAIVGRLVVGFGEIELAVCRNAGNGLGNYEVVMRALYKQRATSGRVDTADALIESAYADAGLAVMYASTMDMVRYCLKVRNHYAHCNWADDPNGSGLFLPTFRFQQIPHLDSSSICCGTWMSHCSKRKKCIFRTPWNG